MLPKF